MNNRITFRAELRRDELWHGINKVEVGQYVVRLEGTKKRLANLYQLSWGEIGISNEEVSYLTEQIDSELKLARFYLDYFKRMKEPDFNKWVFTKDAKGSQGWNHDKIIGDTWTRTNGKIRVVIIIKNNTTSTRISREIENDSEFLNFYERPSNYQEVYSNLRKMESIADYIEVLKTDAENIFKECEYPRYCEEKRQIDLVDKLLHLTE